MKDAFVHLTESASNSSKERIAGSQLAEEGSVSQLLCGPKHDNSGRYPSQGLRPELRTVGKYADTTWNVWKPESEAPRERTNLGHLSKEGSRTPRKFGLSASSKLPHKASYS